MNKPVTKLGPGREAGLAFNVRIIRDLFDIFQDLMKKFCSFARLFIKLPKPGNKEVTFF